MVPTMDKAALLNRKRRAPKVAVTPGMMAAGLEALKQMTDDVEAFSDRDVCAGIFAEMWRVYWDEVLAEAKKRAARPKLLLP